MLILVLFAHVGGRLGFRYFPRVKNETSKYQIVFIAGDGMSKVGIITF